MSPLLNIGCAGMCAGHKEEKPEDFSDLYSLAKIGSKALETVNGASYLIGSIPDLLYIASGASVYISCI